MGDVRFAQHYERLKAAPNRVATLRALQDEDVVEALAHAARDQDPLLSNVLATDLLNRLRRMRLVVDVLEECVIVLDREGRIALLNRAAGQTLGRLSSEAHGVPLEEILQVEEPGQASTGSPRLLSPLRTGAPVRLDACHLAVPGGRRLLVDLRSAPIVTDANVTGAVVSFHKSTPRQKDGGSGSWP